MSNYLKIILSTLIFIKVTHAEPYINTSDLTLKASINHLANAGYIKTPINTYPLMWIDINKEIKKINPINLSAIEKTSYLYIKNQLNIAARKKLELTANISNKNKRFTSFGDNFRNKNNIKISASHVMDSFAYKISPTLTIDSIEGDKVQFNDSYIAARLGNWNFSLGTQDRWWGPGWDSNIGLTNNARPMLSAAITRNIALPFTVPFTDNYQIPWNVTTFMGKMEEARHVPNTLLWGFRLSFIPIENLEVSIIRLAQWGGKDRPHSLGTFKNLLLGIDNCGVDGLDCGENSKNQPGNQQAGYDFRYSFNLLNSPMSFYGQYFGEDGKAGGGINFITKPAIQMGFDGQASLFNQSFTWFTEYSFTYKACGKERIIYNCFFEHGLYQTGMRYKKRNIGHLYDNDAKSIVLGMIGHTTSGIKWDTRLRYVELNKDNSDKYPDDENKGNTVSKIAEDLIMLSANVAKKINNITYKIGTELSQSSFINQDNQYDANISVSINYQL